MSYFINFTKSELQTMHLAEEFKDIIELSKKLKKSKSQTYRILQKLRINGIIENNNLSNLPYLKKMILLIKKNENLIELFKDSGLPVLLQLLSPKTVSEINSITSYNTQTIYKILQKAKTIGLIKFTDKKYALNESNWSEAKYFFESLREQEMSFDSRIPKDSIIYFKSEKEILFSNDESLDASLTAFSAFGKGKIKFFPVTNYFVLPKQKLSVQKIYEHSVKVIKKNQDYRLLLILGVFVLKNNIRVDEISKNLFKVFAGKTIDNYPSVGELRKKAKEYGVIE